MAKFFSIPFAETGDKISPPNPTQADGTVSYAQGFGFDYQRNTDGTDPLAKVFPREQFNGIVNDITGAIGEIQLNGLPIWQDLTPKTPYPVGAMVRYANKNWVSLVANNTVTPAEGVSWTEATVSTYSKVQIDAKLNLKADKATTLAGYGITDAYTKLQSDSRYLIYSNNLSELSNPSVARTNLGLGNAAVREVQSSVSDLTPGALAIVGMGGICGKGTLTTVDAQGLDGFAGVLNVDGAANLPSGVTLGSMLRMPVGATAEHRLLIARGGTYPRGYLSVAASGLNQPWVEIYSTGNVPTYSRSLIASTDAASARTTLDVYSRAQSDALGIGVEQTWIDVTGSRTAGTSYLNSTGKPIMVATRHTAVSNAKAFEVSANGSAWIAVGTSILNGGISNTVIIPPGWYYRAANIAGWAELR